MPSTILFVCRANQFRSQLAAAYFIYKLHQQPDIFEMTVDSAGTWAVNGLPIAMDVRREIEYLNLPGFAENKSKQINEELCNNAALIIVMEQGQKEALTWEFPSKKRNIFLLSEISSNDVFDINDPAEQGVNAQMVIDEIYLLIDKGFSRIIQMYMDFDKNI